MENTRSSAFPPAYEKTIILSSKYECVCLVISYDNDVRISSNSWSIRIHYTYDEFCMQTDRFMWEHNDLLIVFAAGNEGSAGFVEVFYFD